MLLAFAALFQVVALVLTFTTVLPSTDKVARLVPQTPESTAAATAVAAEAVASADAIFPPITPFPMAYVDPGPLQATAEVTPRRAPAIPNPNTNPRTPPPANRDRCGAQPNPWDYTFCGGAAVSNPPANFCRYFPCVPNFWSGNNGYIVQCANGLFSATGGTSRACKNEKGVARTLFGPEEE